MKRISLVLALAGMCTLELTTASPALALETYEAKMEATDAASQALGYGPGMAWVEAQLAAGWVAPAPLSSGLWYR